MHLFAIQRLRVIFVKFFLDLINQLNSLVDLDQDGYFSRSEVKNVYYCYLRIAFQKLTAFGIPQDDIVCQISSLATVITFF